MDNKQKPRKNRTREELEEELENAYDNAGVAKYPNPNPTRYQSEFLSYKALEEFTNEMMNEKDPL